MKLRGLTLDREIIYFDVTDVPVMLNDNMVILAKRKNSPIIVAQSVSRGSDDGKIFETDFVFSDSQPGVIGFVVYTDGFYIWSNQEDVLIPIRNTDGLRFVSNTQMHRVSEMLSRRSRIRFGSGSRRFYMDRIIYYKDDELFITIKSSGPPITLNSLRYGTGVNADVHELMYGQVLECGKIIMRDYHPMVELYDGNVRELEVSDYDYLGVAGNS